MYLSIGVNIPRWDSWAPLHAPDGFFSLPLAIAGYVVVALVIAFAARQTNRELSERMVPMMGVMGAFIFAAQMINFPVAGGTSGHLVGGALAAIILGPWAAILVMTAVVGEVRASGRPALVEAKTYRHRGHHGGDSGRHYRPADEIEAWLAKDPILRLSRRLAEAGVAQMTIDDVLAEAQREIDDAVDFAEASPLPDPESAFLEVYGGDSGE